MKVEIKTGRKEGFDSSFNLFFENGLRLRTEDLTWMGADDKAKVAVQFQQVVKALKTAGFTVVSEEVARERL